VMSLDVEKEKADSPDWLENTVTKIAEQTKYGVLISFVSTEVDQLNQFSHMLKKENDGLKIIVGGVHATFHDLELAENSNIDFVIRGEGEVTVLELCDAIVNNTKVKNIQGITYKEEGQLRKNADRQFIYLEDTPTPAYHYIKDFMDKVVISAMFSRGCPYSCSYCAESNFWTSKVRYKSVKKFVDELELLCNEYNQHFIHIADSTFGVNRQKLTELCDELEKRKLKAFFSINIRPDVFMYMGEEMLIRLKNLNFVEMYMGIESADPQVIKSLKRKPGNMSLTDTLKKIKQIGIPLVKLYLMLGSPADNRFSFEKTVELVELLLKEELIFYATGKYFVPSVGSALYNESEYDMLKNGDSIRLDRYNSPPVYVADGTVAQEIDLYLQMIQVVQYKYYLKKSSRETQEQMDEKWNQYVNGNYIRSYYF